MKGYGGLYLTLCDLSKKSKSSNQKSDRFITTVQLFEHVAMFKIMATCHHGFEMWVKKNFVRK